MKDTQLFESVEIEDPQNAEIYSDREGKYIMITAPDSVLPHDKRHLSDLPC